MNDVKVKPPIAEVFYDEHDLNASRLYEKFSKDRSLSELLLQASNEIARSSNPEAEKISTLYRAWYFREKGVKEENNEKARKFLLKSLSEFKKVLPKDDVILRKVELEFLRRKLDRSKKQPDPKIFLRRATLFKELGQDREHDKDMALYHLFLLMHSLGSLSREEAIKQADQMLDYAQKGLDNELLFKAKALYHQIKANNVFNPKERQKELEKAVEAIKKTSDKYGQDITETEVLMAKAMSTADRNRRNTLLSAVADNYKKRGLKKREDFVRNLMSPIPVKAAKIVYLCDQSIEKLRVIEKKLVALKAQKKPAAVFYHIGYLMERIKDVRRIMIRMALTRKDLTDLQIKIQALTPERIAPGKPFSKRLQVVHRKNDDLRDQMRQDMESLYIYGNLLLDQWSYIISYIAGYEVPKDQREIAAGKKDINFAGLLNLLQAKGYKGELSQFWKLHKKDIIWLNFHLRWYRNIFVEHMRKPWQRGTTMASYGDDFNFHIPTPVGYIDDTERKKILQDIYKLAPKRLKDMPDDYWEKKNLHRALEVTLYYIDELENQSDRDKVWEAWHTLGGSAPSYDTIGIRLLNYLFTSLKTIGDFADKHPKLIKFGVFT